MAAVAERHAEAFLYLEEEKCIRLLSLIENILSGKYNNDAVENGLDFIKLFAESLIQNRYSQFPHSHLIGQKLLEVSLSFSLKSFFKILIFDLKNVPLKLLELCMVNFKTLNII